MFYHKLYEKASVDGGNKPKSFYKHYLCSTGWSDYQ